MERTFINIAPFLLLILLGFLLRLTKIADSNWEKAFNRFSFYIGFPALIFYGLLHSPHSIEDNLDIVVINSVLILSLFLIAFLISWLTKSSREMRNTILICLPFSNIAFLGIPIVGSILGPGSLGQLAIIASTYLFWIFFIGITLLELNNTGKLNILKLVFNVFRNPLLLATILGIVCNSGEVILPRIIDQPIALLSKAVTPLVLVAIGIFMYEHRKFSIREIKWSIGYVLVGMVAVPILAYLILDSMKQPSMATVLESSMPLAITPFAIADLYPMDKKLIATVIVLSTIFAFITIPLLTEVFINL